MSKLVSLDNWKLLFILLKISEKGSVKTSISLSTRSLAKDLGCSQQSTSRYLKELSALGLIDRSLSSKGERVRVTEKGLREMNSLRYRLDFLLGSQQFLEMEGTVFSGLKEGAYYIGQEGYKRQFREKLGFDPYLGTLNVRLKSAEDRLKMEALPGIQVDAFEAGDRTFGPAKCYEAAIDGEKAAIVVALRSHYDPSVMEVISPVYLREKLNLKDGDSVKIRVPLSRGR